MFHKVPDCIWWVNPFTNHTRGTFSSSYSQMHSSSRLRWALHGRQRPWYHVATVQSICVVFAAPWRYTGWMVTVSLLVCISCVVVTRARMPRLRQLGRLCHGQDSCIPYHLLRYCGQESHTLYDLPRQAWGCCGQGSHTPYNLLCHMSVCCGQDSPTLYNLPPQACSLDNVLSGLWRYRTTCLSAVLRADCCWVCLWTSIFGQAGCWYVGRPVAGQLLLHGQCWWRMFPRSLFSSLN